MKCCNELMRRFNMWQFRRNHKTKQNSSINRKIICCSSKPGYFETSDTSGDDAMAKYDEELIKKALEVLSGDDPSKIPSLNLDKSEGEEEASQQKNKSNALFKSFMRDSQGANIPPPGPSCVCDVSTINLPDPIPCPAFPVENWQKTEEDVTEIDLDLEKAMEEEVRRVREALGPDADQFELMEALCAAGVPEVGDEPEDIHPDVAAAMMHTEEIGLHLGDAPEKMYSYLFRTKYSGVSKVDVLPGEEDSAVPGRMTSMADGTFVICDAGGEDIEKPPSTEVYSKTVGSPPEPGYMESGTLLTQGEIRLTSIPSRVLNEAWSYAQPDNFQQRNVRDFTHFIVNLTLQEDDADKNRLETVFLQLAFHLLQFCILQLAFHLLQFSILQLPLFVLPLLQVDFLFLLFYMDRLQVVQVLRLFHKDLDQDNHLGKKLHMCNHMGFY
ncbi:hypothetical protein C0J52_11538 [Blattella germanica]|nr:hypothetical protein C0J52_11538 [Blattella germanica]